MSEATRLEQAISHNEAESFDLAELVPGCVNAYQMMHPLNEIELDVQVDKVIIKGSPEMFAQMLDKVVTNALEFKLDDTAVRIRLFTKDNKTMLSVTNTGPLLPDNMHNQLLNSMISVRKSTSAEQSHLGLGLYIANMIAQYHAGVLSIDNLPDHSGVVVICAFDC
jgi:two-component system sensor histidine kinase ChvG